MRMNNLLNVLVLALMMIITIGGCQPMRGPTTRSATEGDTSSPKKASDPADDDAAATKEKEPHRTLYDRIGGEATIVAVVDDLVARTIANPRVNFTRRGTPRQWQPTPQNLTLLKKRLIQFLGTATGGPQRYQGQDMRTAHRGMQISDREFDAFTKDLQASLEQAGVKAKERKELLEIVESARGTIVEAAKAR